MTRTLQVRRGSYVDSVALMQVSRRVAGLPGVGAALVAMATELNLELASSMGFDLPDRAAPNEMLVAVEAATDDDTLPRLFAGPSGQAALANHSWSYVADDGSIDGWVLSESFQPGSSGGIGHDGSDLFANLVGSQHVLDFVDIEITEAWYPMQVVEKRGSAINFAFFIGAANPREMVIGTADRPATPDDQRGRENE